MPTAAGGDDPLLAALAGRAAARFPDHRWREPIQRSALAIKGLTYMPTGATVAALTTSLPETPGGERNWDYRYTWMRDSTFTLQALHLLGLDWEADEFMQFVGRHRAQQRRRPADHVRDRRAPRPDRVVPRGALGLRRRAARSGSATAPSTSARTTSSAPCWTRSSCTRAQPAAAPPPVADRRVPGRVRHQGVAPARPGHLGGARQAPALRLLEAHVLGGDGPRRQAGRDPRQPRPAAKWAGHRRRDQGRHPRARGDQGRRAAPALRHRRARCLDAAGGDLRLPARRATSGCTQACWRSPTS